MLKRARVAALVAAKRRAVLISPAVLHLKATVGSPVRPAVGTIENAPTNGLTRTADVFKTANGRAF